ncbi:Cytosolic copper metallochaperone [Xanthoria parietina]
MATAPHHYKFQITMSCSGCSGAIERVLKKLEGIQSYTVSLEAQSADIYAEDGLAYETVLEKIRKTGKTVVKGERDGVEVAV